MVRKPSLTRIEEGLSVIRPECGLANAVVAVEFSHGVLHTILARLSRAAHSTISIPIPVTASTP